MFEVGFTEIILILGLALLVLGPEKLPGLAAKVGRWTGRARSMARQLRTQLEQEVTLEELAKTRAQTQPDGPASSSPYVDPTSHADIGTQSDLDAQVSHDHVEPAAPMPEAVSTDEPVPETSAPATAKTPQ